MDWIGIIIWAVIVLGSATVLVLLYRLRQANRRFVARERSRMGMNGWLYQLRAAQVGSAFMDSGAPDVGNLAEKLRNVGVKVIVTRPTIFGHARRPIVYYLERVGADKDNGDIILIVDGEARL